MEMKEIESAVEGILFASGEPVQTDRICVALEMDRPTVEQVLQKLMDYYAYERRGIRLLRMEDTWQLCSAPDYADVIRKAFEIRKPAKLSQPALEVLTIIAYYQPTTRAYVDQIRGVDSAYTIGLLLDRKLIEECGRLQVPGRPRLYRTTKQFLRAFHLTSLDDLPELPDLGGEGQMRLGRGRTDHGPGGHGRDHRSRHAGDGRRHGGRGALRIRSARAVRGVMDVAGTLDHVGGAAGTCDFSVAAARWDCMWSSAWGQAAADLTIGPLPGPAGTVQRDKKNAAGNQKTGKPKKEPKDLAEAAKKIPKPKLEDLQDAARTLWPACQKGSAPHPAGYPRRPAAPVRHPGRGGGPGGSRRVVRWTPRRWSGPGCRLWRSWW